MVRIHRDRCISLDSWGIRWWGNLWATLGKILHCGRGNEREREGEEWRGVGDIGNGRRKSGRGAEWERKGVRKKRERKKDIKEEVNERKRDY